MILRECLLIVGNALWLYLAFHIVPAMEAIVMDPEAWATPETREYFRFIHERSTMITEIGLLLTAIVPLFARYSKLRSI